LTYCFVHLNFGLKNSAFSKFGTVVWEGLDILLSSESSQMFGISSNIWGLFFEQFVVVAKVLSNKNVFEYISTIKCMV
jgi:hypothetical protein